jgi:hypothetical protein
MGQVDSRTLLLECERLTVHAIQLADQAGAESVAAWLAQALAAIKAEGDARAADDA